MIANSHRLVSLDKTLIDCIANKEDPFLTHRDLLDGVLSKLGVHNTVTFSPLSIEGDSSTARKSVTYKSHIQPILITVKNRGSKVGTTVSNLERYEINGQELGQEYAESPTNASFYVTFRCKHRFACSTSLVEEGGKAAVMIQGSKAGQVARILHEKYGVECRFTGKDGFTSPLIELRVAKGVKR